MALFTSNNLIYLGVITLVVGFSTLMTALSLPNLPSCGRRDICATFGPIYLERWSAGIV